MTTIVKVSAHCANTKRVQITISDAVTGDVHEFLTLEDGQAAEYLAYDNRIIKVQEVEKEAPVSA